MPRLPFGFAKPEDSPGFLLWQTTTIWSRLIKKALEPHGISHGQFVIMATLLWLDAHRYDTTQVLIANWTKLDKMTVSKCLKGLVTLRLATRSEHHTDTRAKTVTLTDKGKKLVHKVVPLVEKIDADFFMRASQPEQQNLIHILHKLTRDAHE